MVTFHLLYDLTELFCLVSWRIPTWAWGLSAVGGKVFILLSGICATLGSRPVKRGMLLLGAGMGVSAVTVLLYRTGFGDESILAQTGSVEGDRIRVGLCQYGCVVLPACETLDANTVTLLKE